MLLFSLLICPLLWIEQSCSNFIFIHSFGSSFMLFVTIVHICGSSISALFFIIVHCRGSSIMLFVVHSCGSSFMLFVTFVHYCGSSIMLFVIIIHFVDRALCFCYYCPLLWNEHSCSNCNLIVHINIVHRTIMF